MMLPHVVTAARPRHPTLRDDISRILSVFPLNHAVVGFDVEDEDGRVLFARNRGQMMIPASVRKLFNALAIEECDGLSATIATRVVLGGAVRDGHLEGDLIVEGHGDPSTGGRLDGWSDIRLEAIASALAERDVHAIDGSVIADVSAFDRVTTPPEWWSGDVGARWAAPVDALAWDENLAGVTIDGERCDTTAITVDPQFVPVVNRLGCGDEVLHLVFSNDNELIATGGIVPSPELKSIAIAVANPALYTAQAVSDFLVRRGIAISGKASVRTLSAEGGELIATLQSPPISSLLSVMLQNSQNLYAEMLLKTLAGGTEGPATYRAALFAEKEAVLSSSGVDEDEFRFVDGSGLSTGDLVSPGAVMKVLRAIATRRELAGLLARPGEEGTLHHRLLDLPQLRGKTGTLAGVDSIAGFFPRSNGTLRFFVLMVNNANGDSATIEQALDTIVERIAAEP